MPDPERPDPVEELLVECLDREPGEWQAAVEEACREHPESAEALRRQFRMIRGFEASTASVEPPIPDRLGEFEVAERLGSGGMGVVFRARQPSLDREVAVKLVRPEFQFFENAKRRFEREVTAVASLQHPSVVSIHSVGEEQGMPFYAMELLRGGSLADVLRKLSGRAPESLTGRDLAELVGTDPNTETIAPLFAGTWVEACLGIALQVAEALAHAHGRGILHRDIKPSNVMLSPDGRAVVLDFGLSGLLQGVDRERLTQSGTPIGTAAYMAPEQIQGESRVGPSADIYSLGATLYELLTLQVPYEGDGVAATQQAILEGARHPVRARNRAVSDEAQTVCHVAMARHIGDRYATAQDLADDLRHLLSREPIRARPPGLLRRGRRFVQRHPARATAIGLAVLIAIGVPTTLWMVSRNHAAELQKLVDAERAAKNELEDVVQFLEHIFRQAAPTISGGAPNLSAKDLVARGAATIDEKLATRPASRARVNLILATIYGGLGIYDKSNGLASAAAAYYTAHDTPENLRLLTESLRLHAAGLGSSQQFDAAIAISTKAIDAAARLWKADDLRRAKILAAHAQLLGLADRFDEARGMVKGLDGIPKGLVLSAIGRALTVHNRYRDAIEPLTQARALLVDGDALHHVLGARTLLDLAHAQRFVDQSDAAVRTLEHAILAMAKHPDIGAAHYRIHVATSALLDTMLGLRRLDRSDLPRFAKVADHLARGLTPDNPHAVQARINQMRALLAFGEPAAALQLCDEHRLIERAERSISTHNRTTVANVHIRRAKALADLGRRKDALLDAQKAAAIHRDQVARWGIAPLARTLLTCAALAERAGELDTARETAEELVEITADQLVFVRARNSAATADAGLIGLKILGNLATRAGDREQIEELTARVIARQQRIQKERDKRPR